MSTWIEYVKSYAKEHNMKYNDALKDASKSYKEKKEDTSEPKMKKTRTPKKVQIEDEKIVLPEPVKKVRVKKTPN